jgi:hypothetical protein
LAKRSYQRQAEAELKTLRGLIRRGEIPDGERAALRLQAANVLATLELADAIRGRSNDDGAAPPDPAQG